MKQGCLHHEARQCLLTVICNHANDKLTQPSHRLLRAFSLLLLRRASADLQAKGQSHDLETTLWLLPIIFIILTLLRFCLTAVFRPLYILVKGDINMRETVFITVAGLRGSASLIMGSAVVTQQFAKVAGTAETFSVSGSLQRRRWFALPARRRCAVARF